MSNNIENDSSIKKEWKSFFEILFKPLVILPIVLTAVSLCVANNLTDKNVSLILNILASISLAFSGGFIYDAWNNLTGNTLLQKKGQSAVRNLALSRTKIRSVSSRVNLGAGKDELSSSLSMLEKDIANAIQEWNDIIPGVEGLEVNYILLEEKEKELVIVKTEKENLSRKLEKIAGENESEKNSLKAEIDNKDKEISKLNKAIEILRIDTSTPLVKYSKYKDYFNTSDAWGAAAGEWLGREVEKATEQQNKIIIDYSNLNKRHIRRKCANCGERYSVPVSSAATETGLCDSCKGKLK